MNGWFPRLNRLGAIVSGNSGIWVTQGGSASISPVGTTPAWCGLAPVFNLNDGRSSFNGEAVPDAYNEYAGSDGYQWAGFSAAAGGRVDVYENARIKRQIPHACVPRFGGPWFCYLQPYADSHRQLIRNGGVLATGSILTLAISPGGEVLVYQIATGTYTREILSEDGKRLNLQSEETPLAAFLGPDGQPWLFTQTPNKGDLVYPAFSSFGYHVTGDLYNPDARMQDGRLRIVGSTSAGVLREVWIDFSAPRQDLRLL